jgi:hypothetical protein
MHVGVMGNLTLRNWRDSASPLILKNGERMCQTIFSPGVSSMANTKRFLSLIISVLGMVLSPFFSNPPSPDNDELRSIVELAWQQYYTAKVMLAVYRCKDSYQDTMLGLNQYLNVRSCIVDRWLVAYFVEPDGNYRPSKASMLGVLCKHQRRLQHQWRPPDLLVWSVFHWQGGTKAAGPVS